MDKKANYRLGIDVGSTTAKIVLLHGDDIVFSRYERHNARVNELLRRYLDEMAAQTGDVDTSVCVTGSVGMATAEQLGAEFIQEVVAATVYTRARHPEVKALIDIGGEDAKVVFFEGEHTELRMNGNCAGGTGAFIDQMSQLMGISNDEMNELALRSTRIYPMAARCGVFAKTDIQNLMSRGVPREDIAASIFHSISVQTVTTLSHGCDFHGPILLCGGPLTFLPALRKAFCDYMQMDESEFICSPDNFLIPALGCALRSGTTAVRLSELRDRLARPLKVTPADGLQPLFESEEAHRQWLHDKQQYATQVLPMTGGTEDVVIGIDSGSTTTKIIAARTNGDILFTHYAPNLGNPVKAAGEGLEALRQQARTSGTELRIVGSCSTGYGEELIKAAFGLGSGIIETMAHERAAEHLMPGVSFILDIGGQDMKAIFVDHGVVNRMELNEACSSGCGTFLQTFASSLGYSIGDFAALACTALHPCDLGTRCTVFMNSKIKQVLREGATVADISAGLSYSVINNCLYKVLKLKNTDEMGQRIVVQGGTMRNDAVVRAFEILTGRTVARSNMPEMMGAYGCALHAAAHTSAPQRLEDMLRMSAFEQKILHCHGCENQCAVTQYTFGNGNKYYSGNRCERVFNNQGKRTAKGENIYTYKYHRLFDRADAPSEATRTIGIPRILNMYEDFPFWHTLLTECGFRVVLSQGSDFRRYESALHTVMSDNICFPAKLVHSHIADLLKSGVERILMPYVVYEHRDGKDMVNSFNCPIVSGYSDVIRSAMRPDVPFDAPVITFADKTLLRKQIMQYLNRTLGVKPHRAAQAFSHALAAQQTFAGDLRTEARRLLLDSYRRKRLTILLAGRPYHTDPLIQHRLSEMIAAMGVNVISEDIVRDDESLPGGQTNLVRQWAYMNRIIKAAQWAAEQPDDVQFVQMTSFGCGPDAFIQDEIRDILYRYGKSYTLLKIDDVSNTGSLKLRVRSLLESLQQHRERPAQEPFRTTRTFVPADRNRLILAPYISEYVTPLLPPLCRLAGYDVEILPPSDAESARVGLQCANNEVCYPATLIVGDIIRALQSGRYDLNRIVVAMTQTGGQCRATNYAGLIKRAMTNAGFQNVPLITLGVSTTGDEDKEQVHMDFPWLKLAPVIVSSLLYADVMAKFFYATVIREREQGLAARLRDDYLRRGGEAILRQDTKGMERLVRQAAADFDAAAQDRDTVKVGIVGEIFLKFNHFAHQNISQWLIRRKIEVVPPLITPFFLQDFVNMEWIKRLHLEKKKTLKSIIRLAYRLVHHRISRYNKAASAFRYYVPFNDIYADARHVDGIVSPAAQFGEGWLLPADIISFADGGVRNVVSLQPFGCIANQVVSKGIEKELQRRYPQLNLLSLDFDSGVSRVNVTNRLLLFIENARKQ